MNPAHFQFMTTVPLLHDYTLNRLFMLLDKFDQKHREFILRPVYLCFDLSDDGNPPIDKYDRLKQVIILNTSQFSSEDDAHYRESCVVYGLVCHVLVHAFSQSERGAFESCHNLHQQKKQFQEGLGGDDAARQSAMDWSVKAMQQLDRVFISKVFQKMAYQVFCEHVVQRLLSQPDESEGDD